MDLSFPLPLIIFQIAAAQLCFRISLTMKSSFTVILCAAMVAASNLSLVLAGGGWGGHHHGGGRCRDDGMYNMTDYITTLENCSADFACATRRGEGRFVCRESYHPVTGMPVEAVVLFALAFWSD